MQDSFFKLKKSSLLLQFKYIFLSNVFLIFFM